MNKTKKDVIQCAKKGSKQSYLNWSLPENFPALKAAVVAGLKELENDDNTGIMPMNQMGIPRSTLCRHIKRFQEVLAATSLPIQGLNREHVFPATRGGGKPLLNDREVELLGAALIYQDEANNGMSRHEVINLIMEISQCPK